MWYLFLILHFVCFVLLESGLIFCSKKLDRDFPVTKIPGWHYMASIGLSFFVSIAFRRESLAVQLMVTLLLSGGLLIVEEDFREKKVMNFLFIPMAAALIVLMILKGNPDTIFPILLPAVIQLIVFQFLYGMADARLSALFIIALGSFGAALEMILFFMLLALLLSGAVQLIKGNFNKRGNFKEPIPYTPYLYAAFLFSLGGVL